MSIYISSEAILANLLFEDNEEGIDISDINNFVSEVMSEIKDDYLYFETDDSSISNALNLYSDIFKRYQNRIYRKSKFYLEYFNDRYPANLVDIFRKIAKKDLILV